MLFKALAKSISPLRARKSDFIKEAIKKKQKTNTKKDAKRIISDNFTRSNKEKFNIAIAILEKLMIGWHYNYFVFWW